MLAPAVLASRDRMMRTPNAKLGLMSLISLLAATTVACSGDRTSDSGPPVPDSGVAEEPDAGPRDGGEAVDSGADAGVRDGGAPDSGCVIEGNIDTTPDPACSAPGTWTVTVSGTVVDPDGAPADGAAVFLCLEDARSGAGTCLAPRPVCGQGRFEILIPEFFRCSTELVSRSTVLEPGWAYSYCDLQAGDARLEVQETLRLFRTEAPVDLPPEGDRATPRWVRFQDGVEVQITPEQFFAPYDELSSAKLPQDEVCTLAGGPAYEGIFTFQPEVNLTGEGAPFRIENTEGLAAGTTVGVYVIGGLSCLVPQPVGPDLFLGESEWHRFATGTVSSDGAWIEPDTNLPCMTWLAYRVE